MTAASNEVREPFSGIGGEVIDVLKPVLLEEFGNKRLVCDRAAHKGNA
jgi:hypothetical protein